MPTITVDKEVFLIAMADHGQPMTSKKLDDLCFDFGLEIEESQNDNEDTTYKIEVGSNRYDLLCTEGIVRSLLIYQGNTVLPKFETTQNTEIVPLRNCEPSPQKLFIDASIVEYRPYCLAAVLRNINLDQERYDSFIDLQDKLHQNLGRRRTLFAIGTHDLDKVQGPFRYAGVSPKNINFVPLNETTEYNAIELMDKYSKESHLKSYLPIIKDNPVYPLIYDANNAVLSMPPIINGDQSRITLDTKNILIEVTGTDATKVDIALDTMVTMFLQYCSFPYNKVAESVEICTNNKHYWSPSLKYRDVIITKDEINNKIGVQLECDQITVLLEKMGLPSKWSSNDKQQVAVSIGPTRHDIMHACDIIEDVAIAYGINNIPKTMPKTISTHSESQVPLNKLTEYLRVEGCLSGFMEACTFVLNSKEDLSKKMRWPLEETQAQLIEIENPKTSEFQVARTSLIPGLLKLIRENRNMPLPLKVFEISDVVIKDASQETGAKNERRLCCITYDTKSDMAGMQGVLDALMKVLGVPFMKNEVEGYKYVCIEDQTYLPGRCGQVTLYGIPIGKVGILHPEIVKNFDLKCPCVAAEITIELFL